MKNTLKLSIVLGISVLSIYFYSSFSSSDKEEENINTSFKLEQNKNLQIEKTYNEVFNEEKNKELLLEKTFDTANVESVERKTKLIIEQTDALLKKHKLTIPAFYSNKEERNLSSQEISINKKLNKLNLKIQEIKNIIYN